MATKIDEQKMVLERAEQHERAVHSPIRRFTGKPFTPTRYWHIDGDNSMVDGGWGNVSEFVGENSPIRYNMIENLPLCGIEGIQPQLQNDENGLDTTFEGEATTYDGTIRPLENDFFMITYLREPWIFRISSVEYDTLVSAGSYKIQYVLEYIDSMRVDALMRQTLRTYTCILENIGTDERCIVDTEEFRSIEEIETLYDQMVETYITYFYNKRHNCFLGDFQNGLKLYDPMQHMFLSKHRLLSKKNQIDGIVLIEQFNDPMRERKYQKSIYRFLELRRLDYLNNFRYSVFDGRENPQTSFHRWLDPGIVILDIPRMQEEFPASMGFTILPDEIVEAIKMNYPMDSIHADLIRKYIRYDDLSLRDIDRDIHDAILGIEDANLEVFFITPILLYIMRQVINTHMKKERWADRADHFID